MATRQTIKPAGYRLVKTWSLLFWPSTDMQASVDNPICKYGTPFFKPTPLICTEKKPLKQVWVRLWPNKKTCGALVDCMLLSTSLCHVLMRKLSLRIPFRGMGGRLCRRIGYFAFCTGM